MLVFKFDPFAPKQTIACVTFAQTHKSKKKICCGDAMDLHLLYSSSSANSPSSSSSTYLTSCLLLFDGWRLMSGKLFFVFSARRRPLRGSGVGSFEDFFSSSSLSSSWLPSMNFSINSGQLRWASGSHVSSSLLKRFQRTRNSRVPSLETRTSMIFSTSYSSWSLPSSQSSSSLTPASFSSLSASLSELRNFFFDFLPAGLPLFLALADFGLPRFSPRFDGILTLC